MTPYSINAASHFPKIISASRMGEVASSSMVPMRFSSANRRMLIMGMKNRPTTLMLDNSGRITYSFTLMGMAFPLLLGWGRGGVKILNGVPKEEPENDRKHGQQQISYRRDEIAV